MYLLFCDYNQTWERTEFLTAAALFISAELKVEEALEFTNRPKYQ